jgi:hypothetical protein
MKWRDPVVLLVLILLVWQALYWLVGDVALRPPVATAKNLGRVRTAFPRSSSTQAALWQIKRASGVAPAGPSSSFS